MKSRKYNVRDIKADRTHLENVDTNEEENVDTNKETNADTDEKANKNTNKDTNGEELNRPEEQEMDKDLIENLGTETTTKSGRKIKRVVRLGI